MRLLVLIVMLAGCSAKQADPSGPARPVAQPTAVSDVGSDALDGGTSSQNSGSTSKARSSDDAGYFDDWGRAKYVWREGSQQRIDCIERAVEKNGLVRAQLWEDQTGVSGMEWCAISIEGPQSSCPALRRGSEAPRWRDVPGTVYLTVRAEPVHFSGRRPEWRPRLRASYISPDGVEVGATVDHGIRSASFKMPGEEPVAMNGFRIREVLSSVSGFRRDIDRWLDVPDRRHDTSHHCFSCKPDAPRIKRPAWQKDTLDKHAPVFHATLKKLEDYIACFD